MVVVDAKPSDTTRNQQGHGVWVPAPCATAHSAGTTRGDIRAAVHHGLENVPTRPVAPGTPGIVWQPTHALPAMIAKGSGVIINNSSGWGIVGGDHAVAYCASKGGVVLMTKAMAIDHGKQGIRVNCICPGDVETPMLPVDAKMRGLAWDKYLADCANRPLGRIGTVEEIAKAVLFLASDDSSFMTGAALVVDGGGTAD